MSRCNTCAFTIGSEASKTPHTVVAARLCGLTGEQFDCHERPGACAGWAEEVAERRKLNALLANGDKGFDTAALINELVSQCVRLAAAEQDLIAPEATR